METYTSKTGATDTACPQTIASLHKMQRTKKGPSDESAESSLGREELRIYLTQSPKKVAEGVVSVNKKT